MTDTQKRKVAIVNKIINGSQTMLSTRRLDSLRRNLLKLNYPTLERLQAIVFGRVLADRKQTEEMRLQLLQRKQLADKGFAR